MKVFGQGKFHEKADPSIVFQSKTEGGEEETFSCLNCPSVEFALKIVQHFLLPKIHLKTELEHSEEFQHSMLVHKMGGVYALGRFCLRPSPLSTFSRKQKGSRSKRCLV